MEEFPILRSDSGGYPHATVAGLAGVLLGVLLVSAGMVTLETTLPRALAVYMAPNFVFFSVSIALVGLSSGGVALYVWEPFFLKGGVRRLAQLALGFAVAALLAAVGIALIGGQLNSVIDATYSQLLGEGQNGQTLTRSIVVPSMLFVFGAGLKTALPFFFAGASIALTFRLLPRRAGTVYAFDLVGAGIGCALTVLGLSLLRAPQVLVITALLGTVGSLVLFGTVHWEAWQTDGRVEETPRWQTLATVLFALVLAVLVVRPPMDFRVHRYAYLRSYNATPLTEIEHQWTPLGRVTLARRQWVPPFNPEPRLQPLTFIGMDLGGMAVVESYSPENVEEISKTSVFSNQIMEPIAVPSMYSEIDDILVLMAGTGQDMLRAYPWYGEDTEFTGVELNPAVYRLGLDYQPANLEAFFDKPNVRMRIAEGRTFVEGRSNEYDLIFLSYSGATFAAGTGVVSSTPQFLITKQAFVSYLEALRSGGTIALAEAAAPPSHLPRSLRTFAAALEEYRPGADLSRHVLSYTRPGIVESRNFTLYFESPLDSADLSRIRKSLAEHDLTVTWSAYSASSYPAMDRFISDWRSSGSVRPERAASWLGLPLRPQDRVHTDIHPFFYFDIGAGRPGRFVVLGYVGMTVVAFLISVVFLAVPLLTASRLGPVKFSGTREAEEGLDEGPGRDFHLAFALLGLGFMLIEVGAIQRFELFLGNPTLSLVVILGALLVFSGVGSYFSQRLFRRGYFGVGRVAGSIVAYGVVLLWIFEEEIYRLLHLSLAPKIGVIAVLIFPLGFLLGSLFPYLLGRLEGSHDRFIPWGLAINGIFSVMAANLGMLVYLFFGANTVLLLGLSCYLALAVAAVMFRRPFTPSAGRTPAR